MRFHWSDTIIDRESGAVVVGATAKVYLAGTTTNATVYADASTSTPIANSTVTSDAAGRISFWADSDVYTANQLFDVYITATNKNPYTLEDIRPIENVFDDFIAKRPKVDARAYGSSLNAATWNAALTAIGSDYRTLVIAPGTWTIDAAISNPINVDVEIIPGAQITKSTGGSITFQRQPIIPKVKVFYGFSAGDIVISRGEIWSEWWGAKPDNSTDCYAAVANAIGALPTTGGVTLRFDEGQYKVSDTPTITQKYGWKIKGSTGISAIRQTVAGKGCLKLDNCQLQWLIEDMSFVSEQTTGKLVYVYQSSRGAINRIFLRGAQYGLYIEGSHTNTYSYIAGGGGISGTAWGDLFGSLPLQNYGVYMTRYVATPLANSVDCTFSVFIEPNITSLSDIGIFGEYCYGVGILGGAVQSIGAGVANKYGVRLDNSTLCWMNGFDVENCGDAATPDILIQNNWSLGASTLEAQHSITNTSCKYISIVNSDCNTMKNVAAGTFRIDANSDYNRLVDCRWSTTLTDLSSTTFIDNTAAQGAAPTAASKWPFMYVQAANAEMRVTGTKAGGNSWGLQTVDADGRIRLYDYTNSVELVSIAQNGSMSIANKLKLTGQTNGAGAGAGTLTNAPAAGDPTYWLAIDINGVTKYIPAW